MTVNLLKTKGMVIGAGIGDDDVAPLSVEGGEIEMTTEFTYLGHVCVMTERSLERWHVELQKPLRFLVACVMLFL